MQCIIVLMSVTLGKALPMGQANDIFAFFSVPVTLHTVLQQKDGLGIHPAFSFRKWIGCHLADTTLSSPLGQL